MELIRGFQNLRPRHRGCVATIGNYDGVHLGHQHVLGQLQERARALQLPATVVTFEPTPQEYFAPERAPARLTRLREKFEALADCGIDRFVCLRFDAALANMPADSFIERLLHRGLGVSYLVIGDDFRFGRDRAGDFATLKDAGLTHGFDVAAAETFRLDSVRLGSSVVRRALAEGRLEDARRFLGRYYRMSGRVVTGDRLGRTLGFPTANIRPGRMVIPLQGIFAVRVSGLGESARPGVASLGSRPTVGGRPALLEVHLFDFDEELYGAHLAVEFVARLRDEVHFPSLEALTLQMRTDATQARRILGLGSA